MVGKLLFLMGYYTYLFILYLYKIVVEYFE